MLQYLPHSEIDFTLWDHCVHAAPQQMVYAYAGLLEATTNGNWDAVVEISGGKYVSVFPLPVKKRLGEPFIYQPLFLQQLGLFTTAASRQTQVAAYLSAIPARFRKIYLQLNTANTFEPGVLPGGFATAPRVTYHLDLQNQYPALLKNYNTNLKRNLKKAQKQQFQVTISENMAALVKLYRQTRGRELKTIKDRHYQLLEKQYAFWQKNHLCQLLTIQENGELIAGALFLVQPGKLIFLFSASSEKGKKHGATAFILDHVIRERAGTAATLDFEGSTIPNLARFYSSFGAKPVTYLSVTRNNLPWYLNLLLK